MWMEAMLGLASRLLMRSSRLRLTPLSARGSRMEGAMPIWTAMTPLEVREATRASITLGLVYSSCSSGSFASTMRTSNSPLICLFKKYWNASAMIRLVRLSSKQHGALPTISVQLFKEAMYSLETSTTFPSSSIMVAFSTVLCLRTSRNAPPSPPPMMPTVLGEGCANMAGWVRDSWYSCSASLIVCKVPSKNKCLLGLACSLLNHLGSPAFKPSLNPSS
mmetsp:Transcript_517/g.1132  ORF Transcript_517/g.1132 Transcript_517/m.1132 type:complete len:220 (+) Transcript_517:107-766(+)